MTLQSKVIFLICRALHCRHLHPWTCSTPVPLDIAAPSLKHLWEPIQSSCKWAFVFHCSIYSPCTDCSVLDPTMALGYRDEKDTESLCWRGFLSPYFPCVLFISFSLLSSPYLVYGICLVKTLLSGSDLRYWSASPISHKFSLLLFLLSPSFVSLMIEAEKCFPLDWGPIWGQGIWAMCACVHLLCSKPGIQWLVISLQHDTTWWSAWTIAPYDSDP